MVDVGEAVHEPDDLALERRRLPGAPRMGHDPVADLFAQVQTLAVSLELLDYPERVLVVAKAGREPLPQAVVERLLPDVAEGRMAEVMAKSDRLDQVLVERQRSGDGARHLRDLERMGQPGAIVVAARGHEHLRLVLQAPECLAVDDPVAVALKRSAQPAHRLLALAGRRGGGAP